METTKSKALTLYVTGGKRDLYTNPDKAHRQAINRGEKGFVIETWFVDDELERPILDVRDEVDDPKHMRAFYNNVVVPFLDSTLEKADCFVIYVFGEDNVKLFTDPEVAYNTVDKGKHHLLETWVIEEGQDPDLVAVDDCDDDNHMAAFYEMVVVPYLNAKVAHSIQSG